jgi:replicative superfamily II helicase
MPVARARLIAVSATVPNASDIAVWLAVPPEGLRIYGEEMRPCKLRRGVGRAAAAAVAVSRVAPLHAAGAHNNPRPTCPHTP